MLPQCKVCSHTVITNSCSIGGSDAYFSMLNAILAISPLDEMVREIAVYAAVCEKKCAYPMYAHRLLGTRAGVTKEELDAIENGREPASLSKAESAAYQLAVTLVRGKGSLKDELWENASQQLGKDAALRLVHEVGIYQYTNVLFNGMDTRDERGRCWDDSVGKWKT